MTTQAINELREQSTWRLFGLAIVTLGVYPAYYCKRQAVKINAHLAPDRKISTGLCDSLIVFQWLGLGLLVPYMIVEVDHPIEAVSDLVDLVGGILYIVWGFTLRGRMNELLQSRPGEPTWFHGLWTFLFSPFYFNFKVNVVTDQTQTYADVAAH